MKYGIIVSGKVTEPVTIPPAREGDPLAWLAVQFPGYSGWVLVSDGCVPGATYNGGGSSTNPSIPNPTKPIVYKWDAFNKYLIGLLNPNGRADLQAILEAARDFAGTTNAAKNTRSFYTWFVGTTEFEKDETAEMLQYLVDAVTDAGPPVVTILTAGQRTAVLNNWAEKPT